MSKMSAASSASKKSTISFHKRKGKSRIVARADFYQRAIESESYLPVEQYTRDGRYVRRGLEDGSISKETVDDIRPEDAADAVSCEECTFSSMLNSTD